MENRFVTFLLECVFTAVYFICLCAVIKKLFALAPVNFVFDLLAICCIVTAFVASVGLGELTVKEIKKHL